MTSTLLVRVVAFAVLVACARLVAGQSPVCPPYSTPVQNGGETYCVCSSSTVCTPSGAISLCSVLIGGQFGFPQSCQTCQCSPAVGSPSTTVSGNYGLTQACSAFSLSSQIAVQQFGQALLVQQLPPNPQAANLFGSVVGQQVSVATSDQQVTCTGTVQQNSIAGQCVIGSVTCNFWYSCLSGPCTQPSSFPSSSSVAPLVSGNFAIAAQQCGGMLPSSVMVWQRDHALTVVPNTLSGIMSNPVPASGVIDNTGFLVVTGGNLYCTGYRLTSGSVSVNCGTLQAPSPCSALLSCSAGACASSTLPVVSGQWLASGTCPVTGTLTVLEVGGNVFVSNGNIALFGVVSAGGAVTLFTELGSGVVQLCSGTIAGGIVCSTNTGASCQLSISCTGGACQQGGANGFTPEQSSGIWNVDPSNTCPTAPGLSIVMQGHYMEMDPVSAGYTSATGFVDSYGAFVTYSPPCSGVIGGSGSATGSCTLPSGGSCVLAYNCFSGACTSIMPMSPPSGLVGPIVGGVLGGVVFLALLIALIVVCMRRSQAGSNILVSAEAAPYNQMKA